MSLFWQYFTKTLQFILIQKLGPLAQIAKGGAEVLDASRDHCLWLQKQFHPTKTKAEHIANFAKARGIKKAATESEQQYVSRVVGAYVWYQLGGRESGLHRMLEMYGYTGAAISNLRDEDPERWAEFRVHLKPGKTGFKEDDFKAIAWLCGEQKPARSKLAALRVEQKYSGGFYRGLLLRNGKTVTIHPRFDMSTIGGANSSVGCAVHQGRTITIYPAHPHPKIDKAQPYTGLAIHKARTTTIGVNYG